MQNGNTVAAEPVVYDDDVVKMFFVATVVWGVFGMLVGVIIALQIAWWPANLGLPWTTFGRLRPLHTNAVIFAFAGNVCFTGIYYSMQRLLKTRMWSDLLSRVHFWGWQLIIVSAASTRPRGMTQAREYAEPIRDTALGVRIERHLAGEEHQYRTAHRDHDRPALFRPERAPVEDVRRRDPDADQEAGRIADRRPPARQDRVAGHRHSTLGLRRHRGWARAHLQLGGQPRPGHR